eukprot:15478786-Alexandrium_andersonii.AAC.1
MRNWPVRPGACQNSECQCSTWGLAHSWLGDRLPFFVDVFKRVSGSPSTILVVGGSAAFGGFRAKACRPGPSFNSRWPAYCEATPVSRNGRSIKLALEAGHGIAA